ncbi:hypothetical protein [Xanthomonas theicola]|uniref:hypothetical protein n=1 Tax=Xanthomonas theicola TaxID=56464 RepID=UPI000FF8B0D5|nr:hypothetical protein [Xanthomonas theicola]QNH25041.1 hypothetical protein G4Q83_10250 [Xanthomonas theicola]
MKKYCAVAFIMFLCIGNVEAKVGRCDTCTQDWEFQQAAQVLGMGTHFIYNLDRNILQQWRLPQSPSNTQPLSSFREGFGVQSAGQSPTKLTPPAAAVKELDMAHRVYNAGGGLKPIINVPVLKLNLNPSVSDKAAYEFVRDYNMRAMVESAAGRAQVISDVTSTNLLTAIADLKNVGVSYLGLKDAVNLIFRIVFKDGSCVMIQIDLDSANGHYEVGSARTQGGQLIPSGIQEVSGEWTNYGGDDLTRMADQMRILGARIVHNGPQSGKIRQITCAGSVCNVVIVLY